MRRIDRAFIKPAALLLLLFVCLFASSCDSDTRNRTKKNATEEVSPSAGLTEIPSPSPTPEVDPSLWRSGKVAVTTADGVTTRVTTKFSESGIPVSVKTEQRPESSKSDEDWTLIRLTEILVTDPANNPNAAARPFTVTENYGKGVLLSKESMWVDGVTYEYYENGERVRIDSEGMSCNEKGEKVLTVKASVQLDGGKPVAVTKTASRSGEEYSIPLYTLTADAASGVVETYRPDSRYLPADDGRLGLAVVTERKSPWSSLNSPVEGWERLAMQAFGWDGTVNGIPASSDGKATMYLCVGTNWYPVTRSGDNSEKTEDGFYAIKYDLSDGRAANLYYGSAEEQSLCEAEFDGRVWRKHSVTEERKETDRNGSYTITTKDVTEGRGNAATKKYISLECRYDTGKQIVSETKYNAAGAIVSCRKYAYSDNGRTVEVRDLITGADSGVERWMVETTTNNEAGLVLRIETAIAEGEALRRLSVTEYEYDENGNPVRSTAREGDDGASVVTEYTYTYERK